MPLLCEHSTHLPICSGARENWISKGKTWEHRDIVLVAGDFNVNALEEMPTNEDSKEYLFLVEKLSHGDFIALDLLKSEVLK